MIVRRISGTHICLRCQLHLSKRLSPANSVSLAPTQPPFSTRLQHNQASLESPEGSESPPRASSTCRYGHDGISLQEKEGSKRSFRWPGYRRPLQKERLSKHPLGRLHGFRGSKLREKALALDVDTLGAKSEVIVLRDAGARFNPRPEIDELKGPEAVDILAQLDAERGLSGQADIEKNIEEFRPKGSTNTISWDELQSTQKQLVAGFTMSQLIRYSKSFEEHRKLERASDEEQTQHETLSVIIRKTEWMPGTSDTGEYFEESLLRGYGSEAYTPKQRLVLRLLRQCWRLEAREITESIGEIELELRSTELELLIKGKNPPLGVISDKLIASQEEKIEAFRSRGVIRITAPKEKCDFIVGEILNTLRGVQRLEVDLNALQSEYQLSPPKIGNHAETIFGDSEINELARLTETEIARLPNNQLAVSCINRKPETNLSTRADIARRLLLTSSRVSDRTIMQRGCKEVPRPLTAVNHQLTDTMTWRDRLRHWVRWISPVTKYPRLNEDIYDTPHKLAKPASLTIERERASPFQSSETPLLVSVPSRREINEAHLHNGQQQTMDNIFWDSEAFTATSVIVGHVLYKVPEALGATTVSPGDAAAQRTIFLPATINLSQLLGTLKLSNKQPKASLVMRFIPSPWTAGGPKMLADFPPIEIRFTVDSQMKELELKDIIAVVDSAASDVMLPDHALDLRFQQHTMARLRTLDRRQLSQIDEFLKTSELNMMRGQLETPPCLTLPVARHLCSPTASGPSSSSLADSIDVEYHFAGLEYRNTLAVHFEGWRLLYTNIEGGKADGRRGELSLRPCRMWSRISAEDTTSAAWQEKQSRDFIEAAYHLVDALENTDRHSARIVEAPTPVAKVVTVEGGSHNVFRYFNRTINFREEPVEGEEGDEHVDE